MKNCLIILLVTAISMVSANSFAKATGIVVSKLELSSECEAIVPQPETESIGATTTSEFGAIAASLGTMVLKSVVGSGLSFIASWLEEWKDSYEGADSASTVGAFFCDANGALGHPPEIVYTRTQLTKNSGETNDELIRIVSKIDAIPNPAALADSVFTLQLSEIKYSSNLAKRGKNKDLTLNYSFSFVGTDDEETVVITEPIVLSRLASGDHYTSLEDSTSVLKIGKMTSTTKSDESNKVVSYSVVVAQLNLAETQVGNGIKLAAQITSSLAASLKENQADLTNKVVQVIVGGKTKAE